jgi:hypothetical protein
MAEGRYDDTEVSIHAARIAERIEAAILGAGEIAAANLYAQGLGLATVVAQFALYVAARKGGYADNDFASEQDALKWFDWFTDEVRASIKRMMTRPKNYFGECPICESHDRHLNIGPDHWFYCEEHKVCWWVGSNLYSGWKLFESKADWERHLQFFVDGKFKMIREFHAEVSPHCDRAKLIEEAPHFTPACISDSAAYLLGRGTTN